MEYRQLGTSGLRVSKLCLGTMIGFEEERQADCDAIVGHAIDSGVNFIDTADCYGPSETVVGQALKNDGRRDEVVLATKFGWYVGDGPNDYGAGRWHIIEACERSLKRLQTDRIDLYIQHVVDPNPPWEETLAALARLVRDGKVRHIGCSKHPASMIVEARSVSERNGWAGFISEQPPYNLLDRTAENELLPTARRNGFGITPFAPLAGGLLSGKYRAGRAADSGRHAKSDPDEDEIYTRDALEAVEKLIPLAEAKGLSLAEFSLAWLLQQPSVDSAIVGARNKDYLDSALKACEVSLTEDERARVDTIVPPGGRVSNYYEAYIYRAFRQDYAASARCGRGAGAFIPDHATGSDKRAGKD